MYFSATSGKNYENSTLKGFLLSFFYFAVNKLIIDKLQNILFYFITS